MSDGDENVGDSEDLISRLPDNILTHILSLLPVKTVISTSVLSRRWNCLWTTIPRLDLTLSDFLPRGNDLTSQTRRKASFLAFIERFLRRNRPCNIDNIYLNCVDGKFPIEIYSIELYWSKVDQRDYENYPFFPGEIFQHSQSDLESWILLAQKFRAQSLSILCYTSILPSRPNIFNFESLVELALFGSMVVNIPKGSIFPNLRVLALENIIIKGDYSVSNLINSCCPVLEKLYVISSGDENDFHHLVITSKSLRRLHLGFVTDDDITSTVSGSRIDFSALHYLSLQNVLITDNHSTGVLATLDEANLDISSDDGNGLFWLLTMIRNVKKLTLSESTLESLDSCTLPNFYCLTRLEIQELDNDFVSWETLVAFLKKSPILQDLRLEGLSFDRTKAFDWTENHNIPRCLTTCLKNIEINPIYGEEKELGIVSYFLKHSQVLQKMIVVIEKKVCTNGKIKKQILAIPKGSPECDIVFK